MYETGAALPLLAVYILFCKFYYVIEIYVNKIIFCYKFDSGMRYYFGMLCVVIPYLALAQKQGQPFIDSLQLSLQASAADTNRVLVLDKLSYAYSTIEPRKGLMAGIQALALSEKLNWQKGIAISRLDIGINYEALSEHDSALLYYHTALGQYQKLGDKSGTAAVLANTSLGYLAKGNYPAALEYAFRALDMNEEAGDKKSRGVILENIGTIYSRQEDYPKTIDYYNKAYSLYREQNDKPGMARNLGNLGIVYDAQGQYNQALENHLKSLDINTTAGNRYAMQVNLANVGYVYCHKHEYENALNYQFKALEISKALEDRNNVAVNMGNIGETYFGIATGKERVVAGRYVKQTKDQNLKYAVRYLDSAVRLCSEISYAGPQTEFARYLSAAYLANGNYREAYTYYKMFREMQDSVYSIENKIKIGALETKRELDLKEKDLQIKNKQIQINNLELEKKRNERFLFITALALLVLVIGIILRQLHRYRKSNIRLSKENVQQMKQIEEQLERIKLQTDVLREISHMQAHDVRGPVASILGLGQLFNAKDYADPINKIIIEGILNATEKLDAAVQEVIKRENENRK